MDQIFQDFFRPETDLAEDWRLAFLNHGTFKAEWWRDGGRQRFRTRLSLVAEPRHFYAERIRAWVADSGLGNFDVGNGDVYSWSFPTRKEQWKVLSALFHAEEKQIEDHARIPVAEAYGWAMEQSISRKATRPEREKVRLALAAAYRAAPPVSLFQDYREDYGVPEWWDNARPFETTPADAY